VYNYLWGIGLNEKKMCSGLARCKNACYIKMFVDFLAEGRREVKNNKNSKEYSGHELNVASQHRHAKKCYHLPFSSLTKSLIGIFF
jgi:hypothetical protein